MHTNSQAIYGTSAKSTGQDSQAEQLLGGETCETDFMDSSDWPLSSLDLYLSHSESFRQKEFAMTLSAWKS